MKRHVKHNAREQEQVAADQAQQAGSREFASTEELLREDRAAVTVPPAVEQRLSQSIEQLPPPGRPWWKRLIS